MSEPWEKPDPIEDAAKRQIEAVEHSNRLAQEWRDKIRTWPPVEAIKMAGLVAIAHPEWNAEQVISFVRETWTMAAGMDWTNP